MMNAQERKRIVSKLEEGIQLLRKFRPAYQLGRGEPPILPTISGIAKEVMAGISATSGYGSNFGLESLRIQIGKMWGAPGEQIIIGSAGGTGGYDDALQYLERKDGKPGKVVFPEACYGNFVLSAVNRGFSPIFSPTRNGAVDAKKLAKLISSNKPQAAYFQTRHTNWTGGELPEEDVFLIAEAARKAKTHLILDSAYDSVDFSGRTGKVPKALLETRDLGYSLVLTGSKDIFPGLRFSATISDPETFSGIARIAETTRVCPPIQMQEIALGIYSHPKYPDHLKELSRELERRFLAVKEGVETFLPKNAELLTTPKGGFFVGVGVPGIPAKAVSERAAYEKGVGTLPAGEYWYFGKDRKNWGNWVRIAFSRETPERIFEGMRLLGEVYSSKK